ncbi:DNA-binding protein [Phascolarctobacterium sp.]
MVNDLTTSKTDRQNILNNGIAVAEIQKNLRIDCIFFEDKLYFTKEMIARFFDVDVRTIERYISAFSDELKENGYAVLKGKNLRDFLNVYKVHFGTDINVGTKITVLGVFDFRAFLNIAMLLSESENARVLRQSMLDIVIDLINQKTGGSTKYINQRDKDFIGAYLQEENYRKEFTDALRDYVDMGNFKYPLATDMIYQSIFKEKAKEYREVLKLHKNDKVRDTLYSEILDLVASYECGLAETIKSKSEKLKRKLSNWDLQALFSEFENLPHWKPLIVRGRNKMASRDLALRDTFHKQLEEYIRPLEKTEYERFLGAEGDEIERLMQENQEKIKTLQKVDLDTLIDENKDVLKRLKERE